MPTILRQGSRTRLIMKEQLVPSSVIQTSTNQTNDHNNKNSPISATSTSHSEHLATQKFEEQLALLDATSSKLTMNNWDHSSGGSEEDEQIERICRMNNTGSISGPIQFKFNRTQNLPLKTSPVSNDVGNNEEETVPITISMKKKRLHKPNDPTSSSHSSLSGDEIEKQTSQTKKQKITENETTQSETTNEQPTVSTTTDEITTSEVNKVEEPVASTTNEKKVDDQKNDRDHHSRSTSASSSKHRKHSSHRRHRHHRRHSSSSSSRSSYSSTSSDSSRSSSSRSRRRRRRRRSRSSRSSSRSSSSSSDNRSRHSSRSSRRSSRSYSRRRSSSSRSSRSSTSSRSSHSRSRSRNHYRKSTRRSNNSHQQQSNNNGKGRGGGSRRGRGARNGPRGRRAPSNENQRRSSPTNRNGNKFNPTLSGGGNGNGVRKLPNNKQPRVLIAATPKLPSTEENLNELAATSTTTTIETDEIKTEPIILTTNQNQQRLVGQKKNAKGKNKQQTPAYSLKKEEIDGMDQDSGEPIIGPKLPPEFEKKISKDHSFTPPDMDDPENVEMLNDLKYRAEIHAAKNHGLITEIQAQQLIEERETQKQLVDFPLIQMPIMTSPTISSMPSFIVATPNPMIANYHPSSSSIECCFAIGS
ncbi:hypothetical protein I4U23_029603 [Adineta vaga]|nr:hypothetical protein I4U23_029603 [Adineta vaga]